MQNVVIYSKGYCPYCKAAKQIFKLSGVKFREYDITNSPKRQKEMQRLSQRNTVPQIFFGQQHIGGYTDLVAYVDRQAVKSA